MIIGAAITKIAVAMMPTVSVFVRFFSGMSVVDGSIGWSEVGVHELSLWLRDQAQIRNTFAEQTRRTRYTSTIAISNDECEHVLDSYCRRHTTSREVTDITRP